MYTVKLIFVTTGDGVLFQGGALAQITGNFGLLWPILVMLLRIYALFSALLIILSV